MNLGRVVTRLGLGAMRPVFHRGWRTPTRVALAAVVGLLLYLALRGVRLASTWQLVTHLHSWQLGALVALDAVILLIFGARWWMLARAQTPALRLLDSVLVRLAAFGVSYFTFGPQFGGEPLQVMYLRERHGTSLAHATAGVALDKLIELLGNYFFLVVGIAALLSSGLLKLSGVAAALGLAALCIVAAWPLVHILLMRANVQPLSAVIRWGVGRSRSRIRLGRYLQVSEKLVGRFCLRQPRLLAMLLGISLCASVLAILEYALIISFFGITLGVGRTLAAWSASWLCFLIPLPAGLGALEAGQVAALGHFGVAAEAALGATLLMRGRDIVVGGTALLLAGARWQLLGSKTVRARAL